MSCKLWEYFLRDDVESFQRYLASASYTSGSQRASGSGGTASNSKPGSPGSLISSSSLGVLPMGKKLTGTSPATPERGGSSRSGNVLSRDELNARDHLGRTLLHHVASSPKPTAFDFAIALLEVPYLDIYTQDLESGWTALHRALYAGNAAIAQALMARDARDAIDLSKPGTSSHPSGGLIKIKDRDGYSPFDIYAATIDARDIKRIGSPTAAHGLVDNEMDDAASITSSDGDDVGDHRESGTSKPKLNLFGDEVYTFGSNKNLNLGVGDQDDRQFPERITLKRPGHLLQRFYREYQDRHEDPKSVSARDSSGNQDLPAVIKSRPIKIQSVAMSKLHTAILTNDPESNLFMCGFGPGGRLGTGDEATRFSFVCVDSGGLANRKVTSVTLGQDHTLAITENGDIFSWGSNKFGQLGYSLPRTSSKDDVPMQTSPRQIFNPFKKEVILGAAASAIHSVVFSTSGLYTFGKNEGQLGLVDSDARSLEVQITPRRVGASLLSTPIQSVSAIDHATAVLLKNHEVWVFSHYGYSRLTFPLDASPSFIKDSFMATRYDTSVNHIVKIRSGGDTICALSSSGEVFTAQVNKLEHLPTLTSTTNPSKIRNSLSTPVRVWSVKKAHMAVKDVDIGQDGSIIICTASGSAWRKEKRRKVKDEFSKDYKFARIPGLSRAVGVCSNAFGAFAVVQRGCDVAKEQINIDPTSLWNDILPLSPFNSLSTSSADYVALQDGFLEPVTAIKQAIMGSCDVESNFRARSAEAPAGTVWAMTTLSGMRVPIHEFMLTGRSSVLRKTFHEFRRKHYVSLPELLTVEHDRHGQRQLIFQGVDFLAVLNLVFFFYTDNVFDVWQYARHSPEHASRYRQVRTEVIRLATLLKLPALERAAILMIKPSKSMKDDFAAAINDPAFFESGDVLIELNDDQLTAHSHIICQRSPFFNALFNRSGGRWLSSRRKDLQEKVDVDLKHINRRVFEFVLRYMYADTEDRLFDDVRTKDHEDFINLVIDVAFVANELMIDRLAQICQKVLGRFVNSRNVCHLLNSVAPCFVTEFKDAALEYICLNLEDMIANRYLGDLDEHLLRALDLVCHDNQLATYPVSRGRNSDEYMLEQYPELISLVEIDKRRLIDSMRLTSRLSKFDHHDGKSRASSEKAAVSPAGSKPKTSQGRDSLTAVYGSPVLKSKQSTGDLMFQMDDEHLLSPSDSGKGKAAIRGIKSSEEGDSRAWNDASGLSSSLHDTRSFGNRSYLGDHMASSHNSILAESPTGFKAMTPRGKMNGSLSPPHSGQAPWSASAISSSKKNLKDIMQEASESRVSNISLAMSARREIGSAVTQKLSQKERKKIQQQQMQEKIAAQQKAKEAPQNPWKIPTPSQSSTIPPGASPKASGMDAAPTPVKSTQRPVMTLRQTVAGAPSPKLEATAAQTKGRSVSATSQPAPNPSVQAQQSTANVSASPNPSSSSATIPTIQSIRHIPRPEPYQTNFHSDSPSCISLATILMQQQTEKDELREAATAKHNLQDIQLEQEFQEWWDKESRRVQGLPEPDSTPFETADGARERDGRGARGGRGSGKASSGQQRKRRGKGPPQQQQQQQQQPNDSAHNPNSTPRREAQAHQSSYSSSHNQPQPSRKTRVDSSRRGGRGGYRAKGKVNEG